MLWDGALRATISLPLVRSRAVCRPPTTVFPAWCWGSLTVIRFRCREELRSHEFHNAAAYSAQEFSERRRHGYCAAVPGCDGAGFRRGCSREITRAYGVYVRAQRHHDEGLDPVCGRE